VAQELVARSGQNDIARPRRNLQVALLRSNDTRLTGLVLITTSNEGSASSAGWSPLDECNRVDIHAAVVVANEQWDQNCWTLNHIVTTQGDLPNNASAFTAAYYAAARSTGACLRRCCGSPHDDPTRSIS